MEALRRLKESISRRFTTPPEPVRWSRLGSLEEYHEFRRLASEELRRQKEIERGFLAGADQFRIDGYCGACRMRVRFDVDYAYAYPVDGVLTPNWRESLHCPRCHLNNRLRACVEFLEEQILPALPAAKIYMTEQQTWLYRWLSARYPNVVGSEYLGHAIPFGDTSGDGVRNESITRLTFDDGAFDCVISFEVLEHVPQFEAAIAEVHRVLRPGGKFLFTAPFIAKNEANVVRALVDEAGEIHHLMPPEYHGDPLQTAGCLAFYHFGWQLFEQVRSAGFPDAAAYSFWSRSHAYLGDNLFVFLATKPA